MRTYRPPGRSANDSWPASCCRSSRPSCSWKYSRRPPDAEASRRRSSSGWRANWIGLQVAQPSLGGVARWAERGLAGRGLTVYDACYVALTQERACGLVSDDQRSLALAAPLAQALVPERT